MFSFFSGDMFVGWWNGKRQTQGHTKTTGFRFCINKKWRQDPDGSWIFEGYEEFGTLKIKILMAVNSYTEHQEAKSQECWLPLLEILSPSLVLRDRQGIATLHR